jgi:hypothetical protein
VTSSDTGPHDNREGARNRIWQHRLHEDLVINDRQNFFLVAESLLIVAFSELYTHAAPAVIVAGAGLVLTIVWAYVAKRMLAIVEGVDRRAREELPDFAETVRARSPWLSRSLRSSHVFAYVVPVILSILWIVLGAAALQSW